jgi:RHS repeat-associated protein
MWSSLTGGGGRSTGGQYELFGAAGSYALLDDSSVAGVPTPNPMKWATTPYASGPESIVMMAVEAQDPDGGIQYYFKNVTVNDGSHDSGWQSARTFRDDNLTPDTVYEYRVKARDAMGWETTYSIQLSTRTEPTPGSVPEGSAEPVSGELGNDLNLQVDPFTGSVSYTLPIALPPARQGSEPSVALRYGGGGNGWCGVGWSLGMGAIQRDTRKGVPVARDSNGQFANEYDDDKGFVVAFGAVNSRLVEVDDVSREYRAETDQAFLKYEYNPNYDPDGLWTVTDKSGNKFYFGKVTGEGRTAGAVMTHPNFSSTTYGNESFLWALAKIQDINGNLTYVYYTQDANQVYLDEIRYNGHTQSLPTTGSVKFVLDPNDRSDKSVSYATGYRVETNKLLKEIGVWVYDYNGPNWVRVRSYHLDYEQSPSTLRSLLSAVRLCGTGDPNDPNSYLPPVTFDYQQKPFEFERDEDGYPVLRDWGPLNSSYLKFPGDTDFNDDGWRNHTRAALIDINNDGLPDRVMKNTTSNPFNPGADPPGNAFKVQLNTGSGFSAELFDWGPLDARGQTTTADWNSSDSGLKQRWPGSAFAQPRRSSLIDLNGDGFLDRAVHRNTAFDASYDPGSALNYFHVQYGTGFGFGRSDPCTGGGDDFITDAWGPLDLQGFTGTYWLLGVGYISEGYFWSSQDCSWDDGGYNIGRLTTLDINGDGLPDRVMQGIDGADYLNYGFSPTNGENLFRVQLNTGSGFERTDPCDGGGADWITLEWGPVDSQGNTGTSEAANAWNAITASTSGNTFVDMLDINGDGLPDRVMRKASSPYSVFKVQFNTGYGFERESTDVGGGTDFVSRDWGPLNSQGQTEAKWNSPHAEWSEGYANDDSITGTRAALFDINADGLPDRVMRKASSPYTVLKVELNTGTGFTHQIDGNDIEWLGVWDSSSAFWGSLGYVHNHMDGDDPEWSDTLLTMCDINGDGLVDRVMYEDNAAAGGDPTVIDVFKVQLNQGPFPDLLCRVEGRLGGSVEAEYTPSTQYDNRDHDGIHRLPFPVQTASALTVDDGLGHKSTTTYEYSRGFFDGQAREFRGFGKVKVTDPAGAMSVTYFHQGGGYNDPNAGEYGDPNSVAKKGMPYRVEVYGSDSKLYTVTTNKVEETEIDSGTGWTFAYVSQTTKLEYAGVAYEPASPNYPTEYRAKVRQSVYDTANKTGNILKSIDLGEVDLGSTSRAIAANVAAHTYTTNETTDDDLYIHTTYATFANTDIKNKIASTKTTSDSAGNTKLKEIVFDYDAKGRVTSEQTWLDKTKDGPTAPNEEWGEESVYTYDTYGNRNSSTDKAGIQTTTTYDTNYRTFPVEKTTGTFVTSTDYDVRSGLPVRTIDPAGMVAESHYDSFFRLTDAMASTEPNGSADLWLTHIEYNLGGVTNEISSNYVLQRHEGYEAYTYNDGLGRVVQTRTVAEPNAAMDCRVVHTCYDERGNIRFQTLPFFDDGSGYRSPYSHSVYLGTSTPLGANDLIGNTVTTAFEPNTLSYSTTYYWRADRIGANGQVLEQGDTYQFTTESEAESEYRDPENPASTLSQLEYSCYANTGAYWAVLPDFDTIYPYSTGTVSTFDRSVAGRTALYGVRFTGYINVATSGTYTFYTSSNDGSKLYIGDTLVVNNDGVHGPVEQSGSIDLKAGKHAITVEYFTRLVGNILTVSYAGPSISKQSIPAGVLYRDDPNAAVVPDPYNAESGIPIDATLSWEGCLDDSDWDDAQAGVHTEYDAVGRVWKVTPAGGETGSPIGPSTTVYADANDPWVEVSTDAEERVTKRYFDAAGRVIRIVEVIDGGSDVVTEYEYDRLGRLVKTTDDDDNEFTAEYDSLGRKIRSVDPDMGTWTYTYDAAGRMEEQVDARGNKILFTYSDELGRVTQKTVKDSSNTTVETITYTYDQSDDPEYTVHKGQIYKVTDGQGWTKTGYDSRGRAIKTTCYISETSKSYTTQTAYDVADRVTQVTYPNTKAVIAYGYDAVGHLVKVESLWGTGADEVFYEASGFNEMHQETTVEYGNGRTTQYEYYEHARRLKRMVTLGDPNIQDISYTYDKTSNILSVTDGAYTSTQSCGLSSIRYDDLNRLVSLYSAGEGRTITYEYDALGNIHKNGEMGTGTYTYHATKPHAVVSANGNSYAYDACGNMTTRNSSEYGNQTLTYDAQNRLVRVYNNTDSNDVRFGYSAGGARLWKKVNGQITCLWIGSLYEEKDGKILCHVYAGDRLVASFEPEEYLACLIQDRLYLAAVWNFGGDALAAVFGHGRAPLSIMALAILAGLGCGVRYNRRRMRAVYGLSTPYRGAIFLQHDPWRQVVLMSLVGSVFLASMPQAAFAETPTYDPVFYYYHPDHLGSAQLMTDRNGELVQHYGYQPFGEERYRNNTSAFSVSNRYTGQTLDEETGLYYYGARYYDPELARFIQADSTVPDPGFSQAFNRYAYVYNNPLRFTDPTGQEPFSLAILIAAGVEAGIKSAFISMGIAAITGGDIRAAFAAGFIGGFCGGIGGVFGPVPGFIGAAAGGALGATATGGDPVMGAIAAGISASVSAVCGEIPVPSACNTLGEIFLWQLAVSTASGALAGGVTAEIMGGDFGQGAAYGAAGGAIGHVAGIVFDMVDVMLNPEKYQDVFRQCLQMSIAAELPATGLVEAAAIMGRALVAGGGAAAGDGPLPVGDVIGAGILAAGAVAAVRVIDWDALGALMWARIARLSAKPKNRWCEQYSLRAATNGPYFDWRRGITYLRIGDVWKYGESVKSINRYSQKFYRIMGLRYVPEFSGTKTQCQIMERMKLFQYEFVHGRLPPGNLIRK